jgi:hypothetical protein
MNTLEYIWIHSNKYKDFQIYYKHIQVHSNTFKYIEIYHKYTIKTFEIH